MKAAKPKRTTGKPTRQREQEREAMKEWATLLSIELDQLASTVYLVDCGLDVNLDPKHVSEALGHIEKSLRRLAELPQPAKVA